jgi:hypothetical protein
MLQAASSQILPLLRAFIIMVCRAAIWGPEFESRCCYTSWRAVLNGYPCVVTHVWTRTAGGCSTYHILSLLVASCSWGNKTGAGLGRGVKPNTTTLRGRLPPSLVAWLPLPDRIHSLAAIYTANIITSSRMCTELEKCFHALIWTAWTPSLYNSNEELGYINK